MTTWTEDPIGNLLDAIYVGARWFDSLFSDYQLFPYIDPSERTRKKLNERTLARRALEKVLTKADVGTLLDAMGLRLPGIPFVRDPSKPSLVQECYQVLEDHLAAKRTLLDDIGRIRRTAEKSGTCFHGVQYQHFPREGDLHDGSYLPMLQERIESVDRQFIVLDGTLVSVEAIRRIPWVQLPSALEGSGCRWVVTDFPPFAMGHPKFQDGILMLAMDERVAHALEADLPFADDIGWYPYVRAYGHVRRAFSDKYQYPALDYSWLEFRPPRNPAQQVDPLVRAYEQRLTGGFGINRDRVAELLLCRDALRMMARSVNLQLSQLRPELWKVAEDVLGRLQGLAEQPRDQPTAPAL